MSTPMPRSSDADATAAGLGWTVAALVAVSVWTAAVGHAVQHAMAAPGPGANVPPPGTLLAVSGLTIGLGTVLGAVAYARRRGLDLQVGAPASGTWPTAAGVVAAPAALVGATALVSNLAFGVPLSDVVQRWISADAAMGSLAAVSVLPALFAATGYAVLCCGVVHERVRTLVDPEDAVPVAIMLVAGFYLLPTELLGARLTVGGLTEAGFTLVFGVAFGAAVGVLYRERDAIDGVASLRTLRSDLHLRHLAVLAVAALGLVGVGTELAELPRSVGDLLWVAALALAVYGYDRTRSVWVPTASLATFQLTITAVVYVEATLVLASV